MQRSEEDAPNMVSGSDTNALANSQAPAHPRPAIGVALGISCDGDACRSDTALV